MIEIRIMGSSAEISKAIDNIGKAYHFIEISKLHSTIIGNRLCYIKAEEKKLHNSNAKIKY